MVSSTIRTDSSFSLPSDDLEEDVELVEVVVDVDEAAGGGALACPLPELEVVLPEEGLGTD